MFHFLQQFTLGFGVDNIRYVHGVDRTCPNRLFKKDTVFSNLQDMIAVARYDDVGCADGSLGRSWPGSLIQSSPSGNWIRYLENSLRR
jgi:hypothetical protein